MTHSLSYKFSIIAVLISSKLVPSFTDTRTFPFSGKCFLISANCILSKRSILLKTKILFCFAPISFKIWFTTSILSLMNGSEASITWRSKSDSILSSKVEENDLTSLGGRSRINPIVSLSSTSFPSQVSLFLKI